MVEAEPPVSLALGAVALVGAGVVSVVLVAVVRLGALPCSVVAVLDADGVSLVVLAGGAVGAEWLVPEMTAFNCERV